MFKVAQDQLKVSQGWVRCGQCEQVFDATAHLVQEPPALTTPLATPPSGPGPIGAAAAVPAAAPKSWEEEMVEAEFGDLAHPEGPLEDLQLETPDVEAWREPRFIDDRDQPAPAMMGATSAAEFPAPSTPMSRSAAPARGSAHEPPVSPDPRAGMPGMGALGGGTTPSGDVHEEEAQALSFMRRSRWHHPAARALLGLLCGVLTLALLLQVARHERDRIAAHEPGMRPWLYVLCEQLDCTVEPLRQIESVVIDGSAFSKIREELYQLNLTLRNKAPVDLALPAVELVLTDVQDQVLIRRVLQAQELGVAAGGAPDEGLRTQGTSRLIRSGSEFQATVLMEIKNGNGGANRAAPSGLEGRVAGYRLLAFYP